MTASIRSKALRSSGTDRAYSTGSQNGLGEPYVSDSAYHLYNWLQLEALLPWARADFFAELKTPRECLSGDDVKGARELIETIFQQFEGSSPPPMPDFP